MRISNSVLTSMIMNSVSNSYDTYANTIQKIVSNKNFTKVSQSPSEATKVLKLNDSLSKLNMYQSNIDAAKNEMNYTYDILGDMSEEIGAINSLIVQAANATTSPDSAKAIADEIKQKVYTIQDKLNSKYLDNYIFSGTFTATKAFEEEDGVIKYKGSSEDAGHRQLTISENTKFVYNITGAKLFGEETYYFKDEDGVAQPVVSDFFSQMSELNALLNADTLD